jgi:hypothetical protein
MAESDLYPPVRDWLRKRGYEVHVEVFGADIIAIRDGAITVVELKLCLSAGLIKQMHAGARWADFVIGAIASKPRITSGVSYAGFGLLLVSGQKVHQHIKPRPQPWHWHKARTYRVKKLTGRTPAQEHELAGLPSSPALRAQRQMRS